MCLSSISRLVGRALLLAVSLFVAASPVSSHAQASNKVTALVPAYFYPSSWEPSPWDDLTAAAPVIPIVAIMNPDSGPGPASNSDYVTAVSKLQAAGGQVIGYIYTSYGARDSADILAAVQSYINWYNVDGIFLDEMGNQDGTLDYVALYDAIKALCPNLLVVGNPGIPFAQVEGYLAAADTLNIFEGPLTTSTTGAANFAQYPDQGPYAGLPLWFENVNSSQIANIVYGVSTEAQARWALLKARRYHASYVYITDENLPNPYAGLPSYWNDEVQAIALANATSGCGG
jgi:hypothetical protein